MFVIINVASGSKEQGKFSGLANVSTILLKAIFGGPLSGGNVNPARSLGPAMIIGHTDHLWLYMIATVIKAALAIPVWNILKIIKT